MAGLKRIAVGALILECNSFSPLRSDLEYFRRNGFLLYGDEILRYHRGVGNEVAGFIDAFGGAEVEWIPTCAAWAVPYGPMTSDAYRKLKEDLCGRLARAGRLDAVYLALHGSMLVEGIDDPEGDLLRAARSVVGDSLIVVSLDFHANVTREIARQADGIAGYNSFPHDNLYETGQRTARMLRSLWASDERPETVLVKVPLIAPMERMTVRDNPPVAEIIRRAEQLEARPGIHAASFFCVQSWLDIDEMGSSAVIVADASRVDEARRWAEELAEDFWRHREYFFDFKLYSPREAIEAGLSLDEAPVILNEPADNVGSAATGDGTFLIRAFLEMGVDQPAVLTVRDPEAVAVAVRAGVGAEIELSVGGRLNSANDAPVRLEGRVRTIFDGRYRYRGPVYRGVETSMGTTAVLQVGRSLSLQITELPVYTIDPEHYRCVGLFPERVKFVGVKSQGSFKASYDAISSRVFYLDTPGISRSNIEAVPFERIDRQRIYPFNRALSFAPEAVVL